jgi:hypothetical protein
VPLSYDVKNRQLVFNLAEADGPMRGVRPYAILGCKLLFKITARLWLSAGEMDLQYARCLLVQCRRVGAVGLRRDSDSEARPGGERRGKPRRAWRDIPCRRGSAASR